MYALYRPIKGRRRVYRLTIGPLPAAAEVYPLGGRRGETIRVELRGGTLDGVMVVPVNLTPAPGESIVRLRVPTTLRGPDGVPLDVEALPALLVGDLPEVLEPADPDGPPPKLTPPMVFNGRIDPRNDEDQFTLNVTPGQRFRATVASFSLGSALYPKLKVRDAEGNELEVRLPLASTARPDVFTVPARGRRTRTRHPRSLHRVHRARRADGGDDRAEWSMDRPFFSTQFDVVLSRWVGACVPVHSRSREAQFLDRAQ